MKKNVGKNKKLNSKKKEIVQKVVKIAKAKRKAKVQPNAKIKNRGKVKIGVKAKTKAKVKTKAKIKTVITKSQAKVRTKTKVGAVKTKAKTQKQAKSAMKAKIRTTAKAGTKIQTKAKAKVVTKAQSKNKAVAAKSNVIKVRPELKKQEINFVIEERNVFGPTDITPYQSRPDEEYMNDKQLEHFRTVLLQWKSQLMDEVDRTMRHMQNGVSNYPDPVDRASQEEEFSLELRARDRERKLLRKIEETLNRIKDHDYGYCDDCGAEIGIRRLEARPTATQCIECKTIAEIREKQVGDGS